MDIQEQLEQLRKENESLKNTIKNAEQNVKDKKTRKKERGKKAVAWTWRMFTGKSLHDSFNDFFVEFHNDRKVSPDTSANLLTSIVRRFVRVKAFSVIMLLFSLIPSSISLYILLKQNQLIDTQNSLVEASRKSSYGFQLSSVFDAIDKQGKNGNGEIVLNNSIIARVVGLTHALKPYRILEADGELSETSYSPERTQLLLFLLNSNISKSSLSKVYDRSDFSGCDLRNTSLTRKYLVGINLSHSNFENSELHSSNFDEADLTGVNFKNISFSNGSMRNAIITDANLEDAKIKRVAINGVDFDSAKNADEAVIEKK